MLHLHSKNRMFLDQIYILLQKPIIYMKYCHLDILLSVCSHIPRPSTVPYGTVSAINTIVKQPFFSFGYFMYTCLTTCTPYGDICVRASTSSGTAVGSTCSQASGLHQYLILKFISEINFLLDRFYSSKQMVQHTSSFIRRMVVAIQF